MSADSIPELTLEAAGTSLYPYVSAATSLCTIFQWLSFLMYDQAVLQPLELICFGAQLLCCFAQSLCIMVCGCFFAGTRPEEALARILGAKMSRDTALQEGSLQKKHRQK